MTMVNVRIVSSDGWLAKEIASRLGWLATAKSWHTGRGGCYQYQYSGQLPADSPLIQRAAESYLHTEIAGPDDIVSEMFGKRGGCDVYVEAPEQVKARAEAAAADARKPILHHYNTNGGRDADRTKEINAAEKAATSAVYRDWLAGIAEPVLA